MKPVDALQSVRIKVSVLCYVCRRRQDDDDSAMDTGPVIPGLHLGKGAKKDKPSAIPGLDLVQVDQVDALLESACECSFASPICTLFD